MLAAFDNVGFGREPTRPVKDFAFGPLVTGLGACRECSSPPPPPPPVSMPTFTPTCVPCTTSTGGLQATAQTANEAIRIEACEETKTALGLGALSPRIHVLTSAPTCQRWLLFFQDGALRTRVLTVGKGFSGQGVLDYLKQTFGTRTTFFTFTNNVTTFLFAYEVVGGHACIKICADNLRARRHPSGRFTMLPPRRARSISRMRGLGNVISNQWSGYSSNYNGSNLYVHVLSFPVQSSWTRVMGDPPKTPEPNGATRLQSDLSQVLGSGFTNYDGSPGVNVSLLSQPGAPNNFGGYIYFALSDPQTGAAQTPGEPAGTAIFRVSRSQSTGALNVAMATGTASQMALPVPVANVVPTTAVAATTNYTWLYILLGVVLVGGVGYYALA